MKPTTISLMVFISVVLIAAFSTPVLATSVSLSGTLSGVDWNTSKDDGYGNHDYDISRAPADTFYFSSGSIVHITGIVDVRGLTSGSYLQIGLVDKQQADLSLSWGEGGYMFNNSAFATFYAGVSNYAQLSDNNDLSSGKLINPTGNTVGVFDFVLDISSNGAMSLTLNGASSASTTYTYGIRNWWEGWSGWTGGELKNGSYLAAQLWIDTGKTAEEYKVSADYDITGSSVPEPTTLLLLSFSLIGLLGFRNKH